MAANWSDFATFLSGFFKCSTASCNFVDWRFKNGDLLWWYRWNSLYYPWYSLWKRWIYSELGRHWWEDSDGLPEAENIQNQLLADVSDENEQMSSSQNRAAAPSRKRVAQQREKVPEINWGQMDEVTNVDYPEFLGPEHGPVEDFAVDSEPVIFFNQLFTD